MAGGYRGTIHLVPVLPTSKADRRHLAWVLDAQRELARVKQGLAGRATAPPAYRHEGILWRFCRSVGKRTPSAYASGWVIGYNVAGSLHTSAERVLWTLVHEIFHLNDQAHGDWSAHTLGPMVKRIVKKCGTKVKCLAPYAPMPTKVRGGTYYAFQPDNGAMAAEYAAELATRFFLEQRAALDGKRYPGTPFKCTLPMNAWAWQALADEFFGGADLTPPCES
jgi:hypothetical protein